MEFPLDFCADFQNATQILTPLVDRQYYAQIAPCHSEIVFFSPEEPSMRKSRDFRPIPFVCVIFHCAFAQFSSNVQNSIEHKLQSL